MCPAPGGRRSRDVAPLTSFPVEPGAIEAIGARLNRWFELPETTRAKARATLVETVAASGVARASPAVCSTPPPET